MARQERYVVGLDIGTTKVCTVVGELLDDGGVDVIGIGVSSQNMIDAGKPSIPQKFRNNCLADTANIPHKSHFAVFGNSVIYPTAAIHQQRPPVRKSNQCGIALPDVKKVDT